MIRPVGAVLGEHRDDWVERCRRIDLDALAATPHPGRRTATREAATDPEPPTATA